MKNFFSQSQGQLIIESIIALSVLTIGFLGIVSLLNRSLASDQEVTSRLIAAYLAGEGIEVVKNIIDTNVAQRIAGNTVAWNDGLNPGSYEVDYRSADLKPLTGDHLRLDQLAQSSSSPFYYGYDSGSLTVFQRTIDISSPNDNEIIVKATVVWTVRGQDRQIKVEDHFFNWRQ